MTDTDKDTSQSTNDDTRNNMMNAGTMTASTMDAGTMNTTALSNLHCAPHAALLTPQELEATMQESLSHWQATLAADDDIVDLIRLDDGTGHAPPQATSITRNYSFNDFHQTMAFVRAITTMIHREDHHPTLLISFKKCHLTYSTHDANGVTLNDLICAAKCDVIFDAHRAKSVG